MIKGSKQHLEDSKCSYIEHLKFAIYAGFLLIYAGIASVIHAFIPGLFKGTAAFIVIKLYNHRLKNHPNPMYKTMKNESNNP